MAGEPAPQHLLDQAERARQRSRGRGKIQQPDERRAAEAAYFDCIDNDEEYAYAAGVAAVAAGTAPPELNAQRAAAFLTAARACAHAAVEAEAANSRKAMETAKRAARRKRHREAAAAEAADGAVID